MPDPSTFRDSTQIVLPRTTLEGLATDVESEFAVTVHHEDDAARIIGSPVVIKELGDHLAKNGVSLP
ncbi:hypothetical protein BRC99_04730 [Halobacteriales archaeon QS_7_69_60]|nr:MAG: hypothetical protein BRC99_04730 [Halobacteriales archaeon QS_7_69_60]